MKSHISKSEMKRVIVAVFALLVTILTVNAQVFVGGGLGTNFGFAKNSSGIVDYSGIHYGLSISPQVGYYLNDDLSIGLSGSVGRNGSNYKTVSTDPGNNQKRKSFSDSWGFNVFGRYKLFGLGIENLSLLVQGSIGVQGYNSEHAVNKITTKYPGETVYDITAQPVLSYKLSDRIDVLADCDFLSLGYQYQTQKNSETNSKLKIHNFNFGFNSFSVLNIGFIYKF